MNSSNQTKLSLALTLAVCLYSLPTFAATNTGGVLVNIGGYNDSYVGSTDNVNPTNTGGDIIINDTSTILGSIYGGYSGNNTAADNNRVTFNDGSISNSVAGGYSAGATNNNEVTINNGSVNMVFGGKADDISANNNIVTVNGGYVTKITAGSGESSNIVAVSGNTVNITDGTVDEIMAGFSTHGAVTDNTVNISGGTVEEITVGAGSSAIIRGNKIFISGGTVTSSIIGGLTDGRNATDSIYITDNIIEISGGTLDDNTVVVAGMIYSSGTISRNKVTIKGGTIKDGVKIYAGYGDTSTTINDNTVTIEGTPTIGANLEIYGGFQVSGAADIRTGNTLNVYMSGLNAKTVDNFQHYDLALDKNNVTLTVTDALALQAGDTIKSTRVLSDLSVGDTFTVLKVDNGLDLNGATLIDGEAKKGALYVYNYKLRQDTNGNLVAEIVARDTNKQTMSVADGQLAAMGMLRSGADLISSSAMTTATQNANKYDVFAAMNYGNYHMNSVSNIDVQGTSMLVGMSRNLQHTNSNTTIGAFLESGWGTYDSELGEARAKGHTNYYGLGVLARHNQDSGIYTEGSLRVGKVGNTYSGHRADDGSYDASSTYYGLHLGIGKIHKINESTNIDYYGKYFWAHESGTDANLLGDKFDFDSIDSHRIRIGARLNNTNKNITRYIGLAYEYEFSGTAKASAYGMDIASPSAKGSSGLLELGLTYKPATDSRFSMDMGLTGYAGKRQGVSGNVNLNWAF